MNGAAMMMPMTGYGMMKEGMTAKKMAMAMPM
jgi:hypothetical protein